MRLWGITMIQIFLLQLFLFLSLLFGIITPAFAGEPQDQLRQTTDKVLTILSDPALKPKEKVKERRELILKAVDERFDWEEMARRSLARHWAQRTPEEKQEFTHLFKELLERVYMDKVEGYSWNKISYEGEHIDGDYAAVKVKVFTAKDQTIQVEYRTRKKGNQWFVYDFIVEGVGLVNNYRTQFNEIILKSSYQELVKRLKTKSTQN
ncbi:MAG: ABC transporter substrate-binding protein [Deltaproteobacteria bacterium]|nr:ABC transporter substrate-binding protein [Deltaproteobacteria bacterium]MBM4322060.1 ABC transporter substrate-binding protein [Deltaproteobacteria bacterium]